MALLPVAPTTWGEWLCLSEDQLLPWQSGGKEACPCHLRGLGTQDTIHMCITSKINRAANQARASHPSLSCPARQQAEPLFQLSLRTPQGCAHQSRQGKAPQSPHMAWTHITEPASCDFHREQTLRPPPRVDVTKGSHSGKQRHSRKAATNETSGGREERSPPESLQHPKSLL